jgi:hypothetical protein
MKRIWFPLWLAMASSLSAADFQAGIARKNITPPLPYWLNGYAARTNPAATVKSELWAKALAVQDETGGRMVIITTDVLGLPHEVSDAAAARLEKERGLKRSQVLFNSSHTHSGPVIWPNLSVMFNFDEKEIARVTAYSKKLGDDLADVAAEALGKLAPAKLACGHGTAGFAINRRQPSAKGVRIGVNPDGPVDHDVPVLQVASADGQLRAILFGYSCHNTTLGGDWYQIDGDYAGMAQREVERAHPGVTAMFMMLCGGDQNPNPRGKYENVETYGKELAAAVESGLKTPKPVLPPIRTVYQTTRLEFAPHTRATFEQEAETGNVFQKRRAKLMLEAYDKNQPVRDVAYPVQVVRFANLTFLALGGEVVVDYGLRAKREFPNEQLVVSGYCNDVMCYIPSLSVLRGGGYEPVDSMIYYGQPGPFAENVEDTIFQAIHKAMKEAGVK